VRSLSGFTAFLIGLLALTSCASVPKLEPPDPTHVHEHPTHVDDPGQVRHFKGVTPDRLLLAAETVLQRHRPKARFIHERDSLVMEYKWFAYSLVFAGYEEERWVVVARQLGDVTAASVAMGLAAEGYFGGFGGATVHSDANRTLFINYGMFWTRLQSVLDGSSWPECEKSRQDHLPWNFYEPLCGDRTYKRLSVIEMASADEDTKAKSFAVPKNKSWIYVYRDELHGTEIPQAVALNGELAGQTGPRTYFMWEVDPGGHEVSSIAKNTSTLKLNTEPGKTYFLRQEVKFGLGKARTQLQQVGEHTGRKGVGECKRVQSNF